MAEQNDRTFVGTTKWLDEFVSESSVEEQAWFFRAILTYNKTGEVISTDGMQDERYLKSHFKQMKSWFDGNSEKYLKRKIDNSLNQQIRWADERGNVELSRELREKKEFLKEHSIDEYTHVYGRIAPNTDEHKRIPNDNESVYVSDSVNDSVSDNDFDSDYDSYIDSLSDYESVTENVSDADSDSDRGTESDAPELPVTLPMKFTFDNLTKFEDYLRSKGIPTDQFRNYVVCKKLLGQDVDKPLKDYIRRYKPV